MCATINGKGNVFVEILLHQSKTDWTKLQPASGFPTIEPSRPHDMYLLEVDPSNSSNLRELPTEGFFTRTTSKKKTPELRYRNFEHLLVIQMKIKNLQIFLGQKGATTWSNSGLSRWNPTQHFRNYNFVQEVAFPQWMWFRKPLLCFATVKLATCGRKGDVCQTMCFLRSLIFYCSDHHTHSKWVKLRPEKKQNYFTSSDPHHDMLGGGCQVRVVIENMMGRMENLRTLISGFLGLVILVRWALVTMFLSWTTQTGCRIHRTYVNLIGSREGRHTTHLLKCVLLLSTSQTAWKQSSDVLSDISFHILSDISSDISSDILSDIFLTYLLTFFLTNRLTLFLTYLLTIFLTYLSTCFLTYLLTFFLTYQNQNLTPTASQKSRSANSIFTSHHAAKVLSITTLCL